MIPQLEVLLPSFRTDPHSANEANSLLEAGEAAAGSGAAATKPQDIEVPHIDSGVAEEGVQVELSLLLIYIFRHWCVVEI